MKKPLVILFWGKAAGQVARQRSKEAKKQNDLRKSSLCVTINFNSITIPADRKKWQKVEKMKIAVLVSGGGTNLQALIDYEKKTENCPYQIELVIADTKKAYALERAAAAGIKTRVVSPYAVLGAEKAKLADRQEKRLAVSDAALAAAKEAGCQALVLAGWLTVLSGKIIEEYSGRILNLHPALLPKFGGVGMWGHNVHEAVLAAGEKESGCTVHLVDSGCDTGTILVQKKVPVLPGDTPETLYERIAPQEHLAMVEGVCILAGLLSQ